MNLPGKHRRGVKRVELAMTPMIDIVFNLVIFFLLMPSFEAAEGYLPTNLPNTMGDDLSAPSPDGIRIDLEHVERGRNSASQARVYLNRELVGDVATLRARLRETGRRLSASNASGKKPPVTIAPDMAVWHKHVVAAFDAAIDAGFTDIRFTPPQ
jgi:biopolymer transport protein ExbD